MKSCRDCEYFNGFDYGDGTPNCSFNGGYVDCPYNDSESVKNKGLKVEIDSDFMGEYIKHTLMNTIEGASVRIATEEIRALISDEIKDSVITAMKQSVEKIINDEVSEFMKKEIVIGGGWREPERIISREQYLSELIEKELGTQYEKGVKEIVSSNVQGAIKKFADKTRDEINTKIKESFTDIMRTTLTDSVVNMLMCTETYQTLSNNMSKLIN